MKSALFSIHHLATIFVSDISSWVELGNLRSPCRSIFSKPQNTVLLSHTLHSPSSPRLQVPWPDEANPTRSDMLCSAAINNHGISTGGVSTGINPEPNIPRHPPQLPSPPPPGHSS